MFEVLDTFRIGANLSVTLKGKCDKIKNGSRLKDANGNIYEVISVGMTRFDNPADVSQNTTILIVPCSLTKGTYLYEAS